MKSRLPQMEKIATESAMTCRLPTALLLLLLQRQLQLLDDGLEQLQRCCRVAVQAVVHCLPLPLPLLLPLPLPLPAVAVQRQRLHHTPCV